MLYRFIKGFGFAIATAVLLYPLKASADYGTASLGGSSSFTWNIRSGQGEIGYACYVQDALLAMAQTAQIDRYRIVRRGDNIQLVPVRSITIAPQENAYLASQSEPIPEEDLWNAIPTDAAGIWFEANMETEPIGITCVDGGAAAVINQMEREYGIRIYE